MIEKIKMLTSLCLAAVVSPAFGLTEFAKLSDGTVAYELTGPESGELVVLVHGVSGPMMVWDKTVPALNAAGFRTLRFDLYGR